MNLDKYMTKPYFPIGTRLVTKKYYNSEVYIVCEINPYMLEHKRFSNTEFNEYGLVDVYKVSKFQVTETELEENFIPEGGLFSRIFRFLYSKIF